MTATREAVLEFLTSKRAPERGQLLADADA